MKRKVAFGVAIAALGVAVYLASQIWAEPTGTRGSEKQLKIAVINLPMVIKKYKKYEVYEKELKDYVEGQQKQEETIRGRLMKLQTENQRPDANHDDLEETMKAEKRKLEDLGLQFKKDFAKKQEQQLVTLYREVEDMVKRVAQTNGFTLVLQYGDVIDQKDAYNPRIIQHKVLGGVCMPMYAAGGIDISADVYRFLNTDYDRKTGGRSSTH